MIKPDQKAHHNQTAENQWLGMTVRNYKSQKSVEWHLQNAEREITNLGLYIHDNTLNIKYKHFLSGKVEIAWHSYTRRTRKVKGSPWGERDASHKSERRGANRRRAQRAVSDFCSRALQVSLERCLVNEVIISCEVHNMQIRCMPTVAQKMGNKKSTGSYLWRGVASHLWVTDCW